MKGKTPVAALSAIGVTPWTTGEEKRLTTAYRQYMASVDPAKRVFLYDAAKAIMGDFPGRSQDAIENKLQTLGLWQPVYRKRRVKGFKGTKESIVNGAQAKIVTIRAYRCPHCGKLSEVKK